MTIDSKMMEAINAILAVNPNCALVGSNSFLIQGKKIRRQPTDIDIYSPDGLFNIMPGMAMPKIEDGKKNDDYGNEEGRIDTRKSYSYEGFKIDVFTPNNPEQKQLRIKVGGVWVCYISDTLKAKLSYFEAGGKSKYKHRLDIMYYLIMN